MIYIIAVGIITLLVIGINLWTLSLVVLLMELAAVGLMIRRAVRRTL